MIDYYYFLNLFITYNDEEEKIINNITNRFS